MVQVVIIKENIVLTYKTLIIHGDLDKTIFLEHFVLVKLYTIFEREV